MAYKILRHKNLLIDMAPLCDVAFLLLIFFVLCSQPQPSLPVITDSPLSSSKYRSDIDHTKGGIVIIGKGKVFYTIPDTAIRVRALLQMALKYHIKLTPAEISKLKNIEVVGVPMVELKTYIHNYDPKIQFNQPGIPLTTNNNELSNWIAETKMASKLLYYRNADFVVDADKGTPFPAIDKTMDIFQSQGIFRISLLTSLKRVKKTAI